MFNHSPNRPPLRPTLAYQSESRPMEITSQSILYPNLVQPSASSLNQIRFAPSSFAPLSQSFSPFSTPVNYTTEPYHNIDPAASRSTLWMGELELWMDEGALRQIWSSVGFSVNPKVIHHRTTGQSAGYGFIEFTCPSEAHRALNTLQGVPLPGTRKVFRLNWALGVDTFQANLRDTATPSAEFSIFVGDLADKVDDNSLLGLFRQYPSARSAKVVLDAGTGRHRGYGFVRFGNEADRARALAEMPGTLLQGRPVRVSLATPRARQSTPPPSENRLAPGLSIGHTDPNITTVFVGNLDANAGEEDLRNYFQAYGEIDHIKIPPGKGCGFVQYALRSQAEAALAHLNGVQIGANRVRLSWGRLAADRTPGYRPRWGSSGSQNSSQDGSHLFPDQSRTASSIFPLSFNPSTSFHLPATQGNSPFTLPTYPYPPTSSSNNPPFGPPFGPY